MKNILCIYHGGCTDGVAAAWVVRHALGGTHRIHFHAGEYYETPPLRVAAAMDEVLIVDFSYKHDVMESLLQAVRTGVPVTVFDHHRSAIEDLAPLIETSAFSKRSVFDESRCGARITWNELVTDATMPELLRYIDARDRFDRETFWPDDMDHVIMALRSYPHAPTAPGAWDELFDTWSLLMQPTRLQVLRAEGQSIYRYYKQRVDEATGWAAPWAVWTGDGVLPETVHLANVPFWLASDVGQALVAEGADIGGCYWHDVTKGVVTFSLRSENGQARRMAELFGGGGHPNAAGCSVPSDRVDFGQQTVSTL